MEARDKTLALLVTCLFATSANATMNAGMVKLSDTGKSYVYTATRISGGETLHFQFLGKYGPTCCATRAWHELRLVSPDDNATNGDGAALYRYEFLPGRARRGAFIGIAVIGRDVRIKAASALQVIATEGTQRANLSLCTSQEGIHVLAMSGRKRADLYLYLGYDVEPTCE